MSAYRDRYRAPISGYRSQPVSNRSSLYLPSDFTVSNISDDLSDFDRQFKKLLERTEKFTNRVEKLQSNATSIKKGFRRIDNAVTGIRSTRDYIGTAYDNIETRLEDNDASTTEDQWRRYIDRGILIEKAVELLRSRFRHPKATFEYSPPERSPYSFNVSSNTSLVSNPPSPKDKEGKRLQDLGSEVKPVYPLNNVITNSDKPTNHPDQLSRNRKKEKQDNRLEALSEEPEPDLNQSKAEEKKNNQSNENNNFRSSRLFGENERASNASPIFTVGDDKLNHEDDEPTRQPRRQSFIKTLISNKKKNRPVSMIERSTADTRQKLRENEIVPSKTIRDTDVIERRKNLIKAKSAHSDLDNINQDVRTSFQKSSGDSSKNTSQTQFQVENTSNTSSLKKRVSSSSSFHEYNPTNRIPLKERLRLKKEAEKENKILEPSAADITPVTPNTPLAQRASKLLKSKEKEKEKEESFKSRFFKRFRPNKTDTNDKNNDENNTPRRRHTRKRSEESSEIDLTSVSQQKSRNNSSSKEDRTPLRRTSSSDSRRSQQSSTSQVKIDGNDNKTEIRRRKSRPISDDEADDIFNKSVNKFSDITCSIRDKPVTSTPNKAEQSKSESRIPIRRRQSRPRSDSDDDSKRVKEVNSPSGDKNIIKVDTKKDLAILSKKNKLETNNTSMYEEEIVPVASKREERIIEFRTPQGSKEEVNEDELKVEVEIQSTIPDNIFDVLTKYQRPVSEEDIPTEQVTSNVIVDDDVFERVYQLSPGKEKGTFFSEDIIKITNDNTAASKIDGVQRKKTSPITHDQSMDSIVNNLKSSSPIQTPTAVDEPNVEKKKCTWRKQTSIDDMLVELDKINDEMYASLLDLGKEETIPESTEDETKDDETVKLTTEGSNVDSKDTKDVMTAPVAPIEIKHTEASSDDNNNLRSPTSPTAEPFPEYNIKLQTHSTLLDSNDVALITFAKYAGRNINEISGASFDNCKDNEIVTPVPNELKNAQNKDDELTETATGSLLQNEDVLQNGSTINIENASTIVLEERNLIVTDKIQEPVDETAVENLPTVVNKTSTYPVEIFPNIDQELEIHTEKPLSNIDQTSPSSDEPTTSVDKEPITFLVDHSPTQNMNLEENNHIILNETSTENIPTTVSEKVTNSVEQLPPVKMLYPTIVDNKSMSIEEENRTFTKPLPGIVGEMDKTSSTTAEEETISSHRGPLTAVSDENSPNFIAGEDMTVIQRDNSNQSIQHTTYKENSSLNQSFDTSKEEYDTTVERVESPMPTPKKRLSYREKREAHMRLLQGQNSLSDSLLSLTEIGATLDTVSNEAKEINNDTKCDTKKENEETSFGETKPDITNTLPVLETNTETKTDHATMEIDDRTSDNTPVTNSNVNIEDITEANITKFDEINNEEAKEISDIVEAIIQTGNITIDHTDRRHNNENALNMEDGCSLISFQAPTTTSVLDAKNATCSINTTNEYKEDETLSTINNDLIDDNLNETNTDLRLDSTVQPEIEEVVNAISDVTSDNDPNEGHVEEYIITEETIVTEYQTKPALDPENHSDFMSDDISLQVTRNQENMQKHNGGVVEETILEDYTPAEYSVPTVIEGVDVTDTQATSRPVLVKQMSIKEYRRLKIERGMSETSCSDDGIFEKSDVEKSTVSADVSDVSDDNRCRNKRYSHSRKDIQNVGRSSESSSESDASIPVEKKHTNDFHVLSSRFDSNESKETLSEPSQLRSSPYYRRNSSSDVQPHRHISNSDVQNYRRNSSSDVLTERRKRYNIKKFTHKSFDQLY